MKEELRSIVGGALSPLSGMNLAREYLQSRILLLMQEAGSMIHLAFCGGTALRFLYGLPRFSEYLDFSMEMLVQAQAKNFPPIVGFAQGDVLAIPVADDSVDLTIANSAFPHFGDKTTALKEIARVLKNNGRLVICHTMSREMINQLHQSIGGAVANDLLPDEFELRGMMKQAELEITHFEDRQERYLVIAKKSPR